MKLLSQLRTPIPAMTVLVVAGLAVCLLAAPLAAEAQQVGKAPRIGFLNGSSPANTLVLDPLRQGLRELGWVEGRNVAIEYRFGGGGSTGCPTSRPSWSGSRSTSS